MNVAFHTNGKEAT